MEIIELGKNIELIDFKDIERDQLFIMKKIIGNFVKKVQDKNSDFEKLSIHLKRVHNSEYELLGKLVIKSSVYSSEVVSYNLFYALNETLRKLDADKSAKLRELRKHLGYLETPGLDIMNVEELEEYLEGVYD